MNASTGSGQDRPNERRPGAVPTRREATHELGRTGLQVSTIGVGLAALGRPGYITIGHSADLAGSSVSHLRRATVDVLDAAFAAGVRYIDTARSYGRAEEFLSGWLRQHAGLSERVTVGTKWGYRYTANWRADAQ